MRISDWSSDVCSSDLLDRNVLERMTAPLEHLLRNAIVHGIESPDRRASRGKPAAGQIRINLRPEDTHLHLDVHDDGGGLDFDAIGATAIKRGTMAQDAEIGDHEAAHFLVMPCLTTSTTLKRWTAASR